jgi:diguanylate cyclase (GGDEF)-like protein/PAS domain S-box-containing protein
MPSTAISQQKRRAAYADALNKALDVFVSNMEEAIGDVMSNGLQFIADAADLDRIIVFRIIDAKNIAAGEIYRWDKAGGGTVPIDDALRELAVTPTIEHWLSAMKNDTCVSLRRSEFKEGEALFLSPRDVKSILIVPVIIEHKLWGVVTFHDNNNERDFDESCTALLRSAARLCANAIIREEKTSSADQAVDALRQREKMLSVLNLVSGSILQSDIDNFEATMYRCLGMLAEAADVDRVYIFKNSVLDGQLYCTQTYEWSEGAEPQHGNLSTVDTPYSEMPNWEDILSQGKCINSVVSDLSEAEQTALSPQGIISILVIPVFFNNQFWGFVGYDDCRKERVFLNAEESVLRSASHLIANAMLRNEDALRAREADERLQIMMDATPLACSIWDESFRKIGCNFEVARLLGCSNKEDYLEKRFEYEPEYQPDGKRSSEKSSEVLEKAFREGHNAFEWMLKTVHGDPLPVLVTLVRVDLDKKDRIVMCYLKDLRDIKGAEAKAKEAEKLLQIMMDATPLACSIWDDNLNRIGCNLETVKLFRISKKEDFINNFMGLSPDFQPDGQHSELKASKKLKAALAEGYQVFEWIHKTMDGERFPAEITLVRLDSSGGRRMIMNYIKDLREIRASEAQADEANERAQMMFNAMPHGCVYWDKNANIIDCNNELINMLGLPNKQEYLDRFFDFSPEYQPDRSLSRNKAMEYLDHAFNRGRITFEWIYKDLDGKLIPIEITLVRVKRDNEYVVIGYVRDLREIKEKTAQLDLAEKLAFTDPLTGIYNRRYFIRYAESEFGSPENYVMPIGIIVLDLDHFKKINDTFGHEAGDGVLKLVATASQSVLRESDIFARFGGEEFIILAKGLIQKDIINLVERVRKEIERINFFYDGSKISITASAGIAFRKDASQPLDDVIRQADKALYQAKAMGRNRTEVYSE